MAVVESKKLAERNRKACMLSEEASLENLNLGELIHACRRTGERAHRGMPRGDILRLLEGRTRKSGRKSSQVDAARDRLMAFLALYWERIRHQMPEQCDGDCYNCGDLKVLTCFRENRSHLFKHGD